MKAVGTRPAFHYQVEWGGLTIRFQEVTGLTTVSGWEAYKEGCPARRQSSVLSKSSTITLRQGVICSAQDFSLLKRKDQLTEKEREDMIIRLLDEERRHVATWKISTARPTKVQSSDLKADSNEVAIESVELAHEGLAIIDDSKNCNVC